MQELIYADIIIEISHEQVDRPFQYIIPVNMRGDVKIGTPVTVPFGKGNKLLNGYVIELKSKADYPVEKLKEIACINSEQVDIEGSLIALAYWMKSHFGGTIIQALKTVLPVKNKMKLKSVKQVDCKVSKEELLPLIEECENKHQTARLRALKALFEEPTLPYSLMKNKLNISAQTIKSLEDKGYITISETEYYRNPVVMDASESKRNVLSETQRHIIDTVINEYDENVPGKYLIHGITGSGKTEVYLGITEEMVKRNKQVIVLIPEISLTYQTLLRFYKRFGDRVSVVNSTLSQGERYDQYLRAIRGEIDVIIGPRSALFTPFERLGAIIIDEEHESSYKSENVPKYHARDCAEYIASVRGASLILGSATPSIEAYYKTQTGEMTLFEMDKRLTGGTLPTIHTVDLREELRAGNRSIFSDKLRELMEERLSRGEQVMLFINRRGTAGFVSCRNCGYVVRCKHCDVSLTEHKGGRMVCHYCGYEEPKPRVCPTCDSKYIAGFKVGTEQIEQEVIKMFPKVRVARMDADTTKAKGSMENILRTFADHEADVLVGTQMIVKGHDFPLVTLVGILAADMSLSVSDHRAAERTFDLLVQAAGRAGRGTKAGEVVIQTYQPDHFCITTAAAQDYASFYNEEIEYRELGSYPPIWHLLSVLFVADDELSGMNMALNLKRVADDYLEEEKGYCIGPAPASIGRIKDKYRYVLYIKHPDIEILSKIKDKMEAHTKAYPDRHVLTFYDFDPLSTV